MPQTAPRFRATGDDEPGETLKAGVQLVSNRKVNLRAAACQQFYPLVASESALACAAACTSPASDRWLLLPKLSTTLAAGVKLRVTLTSDGMVQLKMADGRRLASSCSHVTRFSTL